MSAPATSLLERVGTGGSAPFSGEIWIEGSPFVAHARRVEQGVELTIIRHPTLWVPEADEPISPMHPLNSG